MNDEWIDATTIDSPYERRHNIYTGRWQHRPLRLDFDRKNFGEERGYGEWQNGMGGE